VTEDASACGGGEEKRRLLVIRKKAGYLKRREGKVAKGKKRTARDEACLSTEERPFGLGGSGHRAVSLRRTVHQWSTGRHGMGLHEKERAEGPSFHAGTGVVWMGEKGK